MGNRKFVVVICPGHGIIKKTQVILRAWEVGKMSTLEKTIDLLYALPENQVDAIYSFVQFLSSQQKTEKLAVNESLDDIFKNIVGVLPDTGRTLEEYREERIRGKYEAAD